MVYLPVPINQRFMTHYIVHNLYAQTLIFRWCFHANYWHTFYETARLLLLIKSRKILTVQKNPIQHALYRVIPNFH